MERRPHIFTDPRLWPDPQVAPDDDASAEGLLDVAKGVGRWIASVFGSPEDIARRGRIAASDHRDLSTWLAGIEELLRCILFLIALTFTPRLCSAYDTRYDGPETGQGLGAGKRERSDLPEPPNLNDPASWRFAFRYLPRADRIASKERAQTSLSASKPVRRQSEPLRDALPLARRWESIRRILTEPMIHAELLAERLQTLRRPIDIRVEQPRACRRKGGRASNPCGRAMTRAQRRADALLRDWLPPPAFWSSA